MSIEGNKWLHSVYRNDKILCYYLPPVNTLLVNVILNTFNRFEFCRLGDEHSCCVFLNFLVNVYICDTLSVLCMVV